MGVQEGLCGGQQWELGRAESPGAVGSSLHVGSYP